MRDKTERLRSRSLGCVIATVGLLLAGACGPASAPSGAAPVADVTDASDDVMDSYEHVLVETPDYVDVRRLTVSIDGPQLVFRLDVAGDLPKFLDPSRSTVVVGFIFDLEGGDTLEHVVKLRAQDRWRPTFSTLAPLHVGQFAEFPGSAEVVSSMVSVRLDRAAIGDPASFRLRVGVAFEDFPDPANPVIGTSASDGVPDLDDELLEVRLN